MTKSAYLKIERASDRIAELNQLLHEQPPFSYILETNAETGERATFAKQNEAIVDRIALIGGEAIYALRSALDHAYWAIVSPYADNPRAEKSIQFPFSETKGRLEEAVKNRLAHRVSERFFETIMRLRPHAEAGGNTLLYLLERACGVDKHRTFIPTADYTRLSSRTICTLVPHFPSFTGSFSFGSNRRDAVWRAPVRPGEDLGCQKPPTINIFERKLNVSVDIVFEVTAPDFRGPVVPTLHTLVEVTKETISIIGDAANR